MSVSKDAPHLLSKKFRAYREDRDWTQEKFANYLTLQLGRPIRRDTVAQWENQLRGVNAETALELCDKLGIKLMELVDQK